MKPNVSPLKPLEIYALSGLNGKLATEYIGFGLNFV
jgi:hypothetical protein